MTDKTDDDNNKPDLKVVDISKARKENLEIQKEITEDEWTTQLIELYAITRNVFSYIEDPEMEAEAVSHLRKAFLITLNPLKHIDNQYFCILSEEEED